MASDCGSSSSESDISLVIEDGYSSGGDDYDGMTEYDEEEGTFFIYFLLSLEILKRSLLNSWEEMFLY